MLTELMKIEREAQLDREQPNKGRENYLQTNNKSWTGIFVTLFRVTMSKKEEERWIVT